LQTSRSRWNYCLLYIFGWGVIQNFETGRGLQAAFVKLGGDGGMGGWGEFAKSHPSGPQYCSGLKLPVPAWPGRRVQKASIGSIEWRMVFYFGLRGEREQGPPPPPREPIFAIDGTDQIFVSRQKPKAKARAKSHAHPLPSFHPPILWPPKPSS
jgi:hypothetical protein